MFGDGGIGGAVGGDNSRVYPSILGFRLLSRLIYEVIKKISSDDISAKDVWQEKIGLFILIVR